MLPLLFAAFLQSPPPVDPAGALLTSLKTSASRIVFTDPASPATKKVHLVRQWQGAHATFRVNNAGDEAVKVREIVLFELDHALPADTRVHGEGFQMLSQTSGTLGALTDLEEYTDRGHYRLPEPDGFRSVYGALFLAPPSGRELLFGFASCERFVGRFDLAPTRLRAVVDAEDRAIEPGTSWVLEELWFDAGVERDALYADLAKAISSHHPRRECGPPPTGWCSWEPFGPKVTARDVVENAAKIQESVPALRYVQIDDGYQPWMGDWLEAGPAFGGDVKTVLADVKRTGLEPALWLAPFVASPESKLFREHPDWFVKGDDGKPLRSDAVGFGGWRLGPWYALDGTHPEVQKHLETLFRTLREDWGASYFKLDALYWGALRGARFHDSSATRVEAYRRGLEAIRRGAGDAFLLGCNHPMWPSLGLLDGARTSMDVSRSFASFASTARENLLRRWMNGKLWWNDPDCALLGAGPTEDERGFHAAALLANGGLVLSGDDLRTLPALQLAMLQRLASVPANAQRTWDDRMEHVRVTWEGVELHALLNWGDTPLSIPLNFDKSVQLSDAWTAKDLGPARGRYTTPPLAPHSGRVIEVRPAPSPSKPDRGAEARPTPQR